MNCIDAMLERAARIDSRLVIGLDPDPTRFPAALRLQMRQPAECGGLADAIIKFNESIIDATSDSAVAYKPQIAFYEQFGLPGLEALQDTLGYLRERRLPIVLDAKRNDLENTASAYAKAWFGAKSFSGAVNPWRVDAITLNGYMGSDGIRPFLNEDEKGALFILAKTSNPSATEIQDLATSTGLTVAECVASIAQRLGEEDGLSNGFSRVGLVVGATYPEDARRLRLIAPNAPFLMPGFGAQAGPLRSVVLGSNQNGNGVFASASRSITYPFAPDELSGEGWRDELRSRAASAANALKTSIQEEFRRAG